MNGIYSDEDPAIVLWDDNHFEDATDREMALFGKGYHFSLHNHRRRQRKSKQSFYYHDCRCAARALATRFRNSEISAIEIATIMFVHEAIEDDGWTRESLLAIFGEPITSTVVGLTKQPKKMFRSRYKRIMDADSILRGATPGNPRVPIAKCLDRLDNTTDTAGLKTRDRHRLFVETRKIFIPYFDWSKEFVPQEFRPFYDGGVLAIKFACDNYFRFLALR
ncbi:MAG: pyrophosphokinase, pyrophosphokinase [Candidatus Berkelbacteria bacterium]|nr:pyrophosphokinase, pyrophosphokinase [Candidatus Berkelbacteria bacterium]